MTQVVFTAFSNRGDAVELASDVGERLKHVGVTSSLHFLDSGEGARLDETTLVVSLGGDGTFLKAARLAHDAGARVVAFNLGHLGFLLNVASSDITESVKDALESDSVSERLALKITRSGTPLEEFALNEVLVERASAGHMVKVRTFVDEEEYLTYSADGVMVATPTGSTGYNFSAGGPVVDASLSIMILTPIAPHFTIDRSIVVPDDKVIRLVVVDKPAMLVADGTTIGSLELDEYVDVRQSPTPVRVVATRSFDLATRLRRSLREGHA
ncbi:MAG TPA: NAD(+)/NADH kinase [Acidimicrobiales bacterium]|nr:NAD(+)/NADH kinase [Acidimicrobiales bacterium]